MEALTPTERPVVGFALEAPPQQARRATVAFRIILAIPHLLLVGVFGFVAMVVVIVGWFGALFTGRMPDGIADFLGRIVQYSTRVYAYLYLLTDTYPPFGLEDTSYPVSVVLPPRGKLNRAAVFFRCTLAIPAGIVASIVGTGIQLVLVVVWLITLVSGRLPRSAFEAEAAALRYQTRFYAWFLMLTSEYPHDLFGDPGLAAPGPVYAPPPPAPGTIPPPPPLPGTAAPAPEPPRITALVLSKAGRRLLVTSIVLGVVLLIAQIVVSIIVAAASTASLDDLDDAYGEVLAASQEYGVTVQSCAVGAADGGAQCVAGANAEFADELRGFAADLEGIEFPDDSLDEAEDLRDDALATAAVLDRMRDATSDPDAYTALVGDFQTAASQLDDHYLELRDAIRFGG
jgi:hypothetical protein